MSSIEDKVWEHLVEHHGADRARLRAATRSRTHRRPVMVGIGATGLAAAAAATVLVASSGSTAASGPRAVGSGLRASAGPARTEDTAYIIKRVKARIAADGHDNMIQRSETYFSASMSSDGSLSFGPKQGEDYGYATPDGAGHNDSTTYNRDGTVRFIYDEEEAPVVNGEQSSSYIIIDPANHTYTQTNYSRHVGKALPPPGGFLNDSSPQVRHALQSGRMTKVGTPTFMGTRAIALSLPPCPGSGCPGLRGVMYVDAQTYQPLGVAVVPDRHTRYARGIDPEVDYRVPATAHNIAQAKDSIPAGFPAGYTKVNSIPGAGWVQ